MKRRDFMQAFGALTAGILGFTPHIGDYAGIEDLELEMPPVILGVDPGRYLVTSIYFYFLQPGRAQISDGEGRPLADIASGWPRVCVRECYAMLLVRDPDALRLTSEVGCVALAHLMPEPAGRKATLDDVFAATRDQQFLIKVLAS